METQGNWGGKGAAPSADRYIGGMLSDLAKKLFTESMEYSNYIKGEIEEDEPDGLPALLPLCFINGTKGIPSGLPTVNIPPLNIEHMFNYFIEILKAKDLNYKPKWCPEPNLELNIVTTREEWKEIMRTGKGSIRVAPIIEWVDSSHREIKITALPETKNIDHIRKIIDRELSTDKVDLRDESAAEFCVVIERVPKRWVDMEELFTRLQTKLQCSIPYNFAFSDITNNKIYVPCSFDYVVKRMIENLMNVHQNRITHQLENLNNKLLVLQIIEKMKKDKLIISMVEMSHQEALDYLVKTYSIIEDVASKVMSKPISYLTKEHEDEIKKLEDDINSLKTDQSDIYEFLLNKYKEMKKEVNKVIKNKYKETKFING